MNEGQIPQHPVSARPVLQIGEWQIEPDLGRATRIGETVKLEPKVMDLLVYFAQRPGQVLSREELEQAIWAGTVVGYDALTSAIIKLRKALGDSRRQPWLIETVAKKGYRFIAAVKLPDPALASPIAPAATPAVRGISKPQQFLAGLIAAVVALTVTVWLLMPRATDTAQPSAGVSKPSIVVLPFANSNRDPSQEYFSDGITDDLINDLSRFSGLNVIARRTAYIYKSRQSDIQTIAKDLGVHYVLDGDVRRDGNKLRLNAQLIDTKSGVNIWSERFDRETRDIFAVQDDIRKNILSALSLTLTQEERKREQLHYTASYDAYDLFLKAQGILVTRSSAAENAQAIALMQQAIKLDPQFARAHAALAYTLVEGYRFGWLKDLEQTRRDALAYGQQAIAIDPMLVQGYWVLGNVYLFLYQDHTKAIESAERAIELAPNDSDALLTLAVTYSYGGDPNKAIHLSKELMNRGSAYSSLVPAVLGQSYMLVGNFSEALTAYDKSLEINPTYLFSNLNKALVLYRMGRKGDAQFQVDELYNLHPDFDLGEYAARAPYKDKQALKTMVEDLVRAGVKPPT